MMPKDIRIGTRLELDVLNNKGEKTAGTFISQMLEYRDDGSLIISAPISEARLIYIPTDVNIRLTFTDRQKGLLCFGAIVRGRDMYNNVAVLVIEPVSGMEKIQRRMHYRLDIALNAQIFPELRGELYGAQDKDSIKSSAVEDFNMQKPVAAITKNISGSGICLVTDIDIPKDSLTGVELELSDNKAISAECKVVRNIKLYGDKGKRYELGLCFTKITKKDQDLLISYIYRQQREQLKQKNKE
jgi:c-di-GMP-binding flagellar brake protein YcgR